MSATVDVRHRPTGAGSLLSLLAGVTAVALVIDGAAQWQPLLVELGGLGICAVAVATWDRDWRLGSLSLAVAGCLLVTVGIALGVTSPGEMTQRLELLPGLFGLAVLFAGLVPLRSGWERRLVTAGAALLFLGVVTSGVVRGASDSRLLLAGVATVLAWDLGGNAVSLGNQVGRAAETHRTELLHAGATLVAGAAVFVVALAVAALDVQGLSLTGFAVLLVAGFALVVAMRH